jgi:phosphopantothenoylcysteine decarboxylase/phosphopantothenate--cysteine ligase
MWEHPATRDNLRLLAARGAKFAGPDRGTLACGFVGEGRMLDPACLVDAVKQVLGAGSGSTPGPTVAPAWAGLRVLVTAGPTRAPIDAVRFLGNASTGAMGFAVAQAAAAAGAEVTLVAGPVELPTPPGVRRIDVVTAEEMLTALRAAQARPHDLVAMVAAVADLVVRAPLRDKLPKEHLVDAVRSLEWERAPDLLATLTSEFPRSFYLGFAAETVAPDADVDARLRDLGRAKLAAKGCQALFANRVAAPGTGFASPTNAGWLLLRAGDRVEEHSSGAPRAKAELARWVLAQLRPAVAGWRER